MRCMLLCCSVRSAGLERESGFVRSSLGIWQRTGEARGRVDDRAFLLPGTGVVHFSQQGESKDILYLLLKYIQKLLHLPTCLASKKMLCHA